MPRKRARPVREGVVGKGAPTRSHLAGDLLHFTSGSVGARGCDSPGLPGEARFEPKSYGFRSGRGCADAIASLFTTLKGKSPKVWIVDADLSAAFDRIDHTRLLDALGSFPARGMIAGWLKAGVIEDGIFTPTEEGTPQGGVISPLMMNVALHGLEEAAGVRYHTSG